MTAEHLFWHIGQQHGPLCYLLALLTFPMTLATRVGGTAVLFANTHIPSAAFCSSFGMFIGSLDPSLGRFLAHPKGDQPTADLFLQAHGHDLVDALCLVRCQKLRQI